MDEEPQERIVNDADHALALMMRANQERGCATMDHQTKVTSWDDNHYYGECPAWEFVVNRETGAVEIKE
jgi:hypothetical protein